MSEAVRITMSSRHTFLVDLGNVRPDAVALLVSGIFRVSIIGLDAEDGSFAFLRPDQVAFVESAKMPSLRDAVPVWRLRATNADGTF